MTVAYRLTTFWIRVGAHVFYRIQVRGNERVPRDGAFVLAGNHLSVLDPPIFGAFARPREIHFMGKEELFSMPILSWLLPQLNAFPVSRSKSARAALKSALGRLRAGNAVGIFPEGGRNSGGELEVRQGAAWLAEAAGVPVVPCAIAGSKQARMFRSQIKVAYGQPLFPPSGEKATKEALANFTDAIMSAIDALREDIGGDS